jgi:N-acetylneuraminic acid mutarotase
MGARCTPLRPMGAARSHFGAAVHGGRLYVFGGGGADFKSLSAVEAYDPKTDAWEACAPMPAPRSGIAAAAVGDRIYVCGGGFKLPDGRFDFKSAVEAYVPPDDGWENAPSLLKRHDAPAAVAHRGRVLLFGGHHPDATAGPLVDPGFDVAEALEPDAEAWTELAPMPTARFSAVAEMVGAEIWCMGGGAYKGGTFRNLDVIEGYDPGANRWESPGTRLPWPAAGLMAACVEGALYVAGGNDGSGISARVARWAPGSDARWEELPPLPEGRVMGAMLALDGALFVLGGRGPDGRQPVPGLWRIDPA